MKKLLILSLLSMNLFAAEVATLNLARATKELNISFTDEALFQAAEKQFMTHPCRLKTNMNININMREISVPDTCRAELTKFFLNAGYKPIDARTFIK